MTFVLRRCGPSQTLNLPAGCSRLPASGNSPESNLPRLTLRGSFFA